MDVRMDPELHEILMDLDEEDGDSDYTHISTYGPRKRWKIPQISLTSFWQRYCQLVSDRMNSSKVSEDSRIGNLCLAERPRVMMPVVYEFTFKFQVDSGTPGKEPTHEIYHKNELFTEHLIYMLVSCCQKSINEFYDITDQDAELLCFVLESEIAWEEHVDTPNGKEVLNTVKIRLQFPYCKIDSSNQVNILKPKFIKLLNDNMVVKNFVTQPIGSWENHITYNQENDPLVLYGSESDPGRPKLILTHVFGLINLEQLVEGNNIEEIDTDNQADPIFDPMRHNHVFSGLVNPDMFRFASFEHWLPMLLSSGYSNATAKPKDRNKKATFKKFDQTSGNNELELCRHLLQWINPDRFKDEHDWKDMGRALYHADQYDETGIGFNLWSSMTTKYTDGGILKFVNMNMIHSLVLKLMLKL